MTQIRIATFGIFCLGIFFGSNVSRAQQLRPVDDSKNIVDAEQLEFFESKVRPIFVNQCYKCHSASAEELEAGLMLDSQPGWTTGGDSGPAIVPGDLDNSLVIDAIRWTENTVSAMPPDSKLSPEQIATIEKWVEMGAPDPRTEKASREHAGEGSFDLKERFETHWSWRKPTEHSLPNVSDESWPLVPFDRFVLAKLESEKLRPANDADRRTWIRRVTFDLIGLPPKPAHVDAFLADDSDQAHERVVDRLLKSEEFGEKWARHWLDLVRYAETYGHEFDYAIPHAFEYRDYLIRALNADVPYDQFVREHIAGDLLPEPRRNPNEGFNESVIGTGFWYLHEATHAPTDVLKNEADIMANQIDVFGKTFLGLTIACAQCHDHKFDAISTADYYALTAYIHSSCRQHYPLDPGQRISKTVNQIDALRRQSAKELARTAFKPNSSRSPADYFDACRRLIRGDDDGQASIVDEEKNQHLAKPDSNTLAAAAKEFNLDPQRLAAWIDLLCAVNLKDNDLSLNHALAAEIAGGDLHSKIRERSKKSREAWKTFTDASTLFEDFDSSDIPDDWSTTGIGFQGVSGKLIPSVVGESQLPGSLDSAVFGKKAHGVMRSPTFEISTNQIWIRMRSGPGTKVRLIIDNYQMIDFHGLLFGGTFLKDKQTDTGGKWAWKSLSGDLKKYVGHKAYLEFVDDNNESIAVDQIWLTEIRPPNEVDVALADRLLNFNAPIQRLWNEARANWSVGIHNEFGDWLLTNDLVGLADVSPIASQKIDEAMKLADSMPPPRYVLAMAQGSDELANIYIRGGHTNLGDEVPSRMIDALGGERGNRLDLANKIMSPENPLAARVIVNRLWHHLFGRGIVPTVDDFGPQGLPPSNPELLDWLAVDLMKNGWSLKQSIRSMVLSRTYRQSSVAHPDLDRQRIAEVDPTNEYLHRANVRRLPAESIRDAVLAVSGRLNSKRFGLGVPTHRTAFMTGRGARASGPADGDGRRSIYLSIYRNFLNPFLTTFDMPNPFGPKGRRSQSNVPAQALVLMNNPFIAGETRRWAERELTADSDPKTRIRNMVIQAHTVVPNDKQVERLAEFVEEQAKIYGGTDGAKKAWGDLAHALLNMKAFYFLR